MPSSPATRCPTCGFDFDPARHRGVCPRCSLARLAAPASTGGAAADPARASAAPSAGTGDGAPVAGARLGDYELVEEIGRGGMGAVWLARQESLDRFVALKLLPPAAGADAALLEERLRREGRAVARLKHPAVVNVLEVGRTAGGAAFLAMDFLEGGDLAARLRTRPPAPREAAGHALRLARALAHAHAEGVLHRDVKPSNVLLDAEGRAYLADFGLAAFTGAAGDLTRTGQVAGTPAYLAPELLGGRGAPGAASDLYGLGAVLYEMLAGRAPFHGENAATVIARVLQEEPPPPRALNRGVPRDLETICLKCVEKLPAARYASAAALAEDLENFLAGRPIRARPVSAAGRLVRWARRNPALATVSAALLLALLGGTVVLAERNVALRAALDRAQAAEGEAREQLRGSLLTQARAVRTSGARGQRFDALAALARAAAIRPGGDLRDEAAAALARPDWRVREIAKPWTGETLTAVPDATFTHVLLERDRRWSWQTFPGGEERWHRDAPAESASASVVSPDGRWCAVRLRDDTIRVFATADGAEALRLDGRAYAFKGSVWQFGRDMDFSPDGAVFAATKPEGGVTFHALPGGAELGAWAGDAWVTSIAFSPDGRQLAVGGSRDRAKNLLALVESPTGRELWREPAAGRVEFVAWSPDGASLASREAGGVVQVRGTGDRRVRSVVPDREALHAKFLPEGGLLLAEQLSRTRLWEPLGGRLLATKEDEGRPGTHFTADGRKQWRNFAAGPVWLAELEPSPVVATVRLPWIAGQVTQRVWPLDVSPDGRWLAVGARGGVTFVDLVHGRAAGGTLVRDAAEGEVAARFSADGTTLWIGSAAGGVRRWTWSTDANGVHALTAGEVVDAETGWLLAGAHGASGRLALVSPERGEVKIVDATKPGAAATVARWKHTGAGRVAFSPDGARLAVAGLALAAGAQATTIYRTGDGASLAVAGNAAAEYVRWSGEGTWLLTGGAADDTPPRAESAAVPGLRIVRGTKRTFGDVSPDGAWLARRSADGILLERLADGARLVELRHPALESWVPEVRFTPDGARLVVLQLNGTVLAWDLAALRRELAATRLDW